MSLSSEKKIKKVDYLNDCDSLDQKGFLTSFYIREIDSIARETALHRARKNLNSEFTDIIKYIFEFCEHVKKKDAPDSAWIRKGLVSGFAIILVADPFKQSWGVKRFVKRAKHDAEQNVERIYVLGASRQEVFTKNVIDAININLDNYTLVEEFHLYKDYRRKNGGIGAVFKKVKK